VYVRHHKKLQIPNTNCQRNLNFKLKRTNGAVKGSGFRPGKTSAAFSAPSAAQSDSYCRLTEVRSARSTRAEFSQRESRYLI
jgi:hypothetical protein